MGQSGFSFSCLRIHKGHFPFELFFCVVDLCLLACSFWGVVWRFFGGVFGLLFTDQAQGPFKHLNNFILFANLSLNAAMQGKFSLLSSSCWEM